MKEIKADDELIDEEGIENLTFDELVSACHSRGIKSVGKISRARLETELKQWLELHLRSEVPSVLLILSRALTMQDPEMEPVEALQNVIMSLPEHVVEEAKLEASEIIGDSSNNYKQKLHVLEQQEGMIAEELAQEEKEKAQRASQAIVGEITPEEAERISMAISELSPLSHEKEELKELKEDVADFKEEANELKQASEVNLQVSKEADVLEGQIENLIADIDVELNKYESEAGNKFYSLKIDENGQLTVDQLESIIKMLKSDKMDQHRIVEVIKQFDQDGDGKVFVKDIMSLADKMADQEGSGVIVDSDKQSP